MGSTLVWAATIRVTPLPPTFHDGEPWITLPDVEGVTYSVEGTPGYDASVTVTATAQAGYELVGTTSWSHTFGPDPRPVVQLTGTINGVSRDQFRQACIDFGTTYDTVEVLPFRLDISQATNLFQVFNGCSSLTSVPDMDTSHVTSMYGMFGGCSSLTSVPDMDTSQVTSMVALFNNCSSLTSVPDLDISQVTENLTSMFRNCSSLTTVPDLGTSQTKGMSYMFYGCSSLTSVPDLYTSQVTNMHSMFYGCTSLTDGNVHLIGRHPDVNTTSMIDNSGLTREPFYDTNGNPI